MENEIKSYKGITLVTLIVTTLILLILISVAITEGIFQINEMKLRGFYTKLEIAQEGIEKIVNTNENYIDKDNNKIYLKDLGNTLTEQQKSLIKSLGYDTTNFKYFTAEEVENDLGISGVNLNLLIDFENKTIICSEGVKIGNTIYYTLKNDKYTVNLDESKNIGNVDFDYAVSKYGSDSYKITVTPINIGDIEEGILKYRKTGVEYWTVAKSNEIIINQLSSYDIMYIDANNNSITKTIKLVLNSNGNVISSE